MTELPVFCIVIPVTHSLEYLRSCLESLARLAYPKSAFHTVVVDCGSVVGLARFLAEIRPQLDLSFTTLILPARTPSGLAWLQEYRMNEARNAAAHACPAQNYLFIEDDTSMPPDLLRKAEAWLTPETGALGGPDILPPQMDVMAEALDIMLNSGLGSPGRSKGAFSDDVFIPRKDYFLVPSAVYKMFGPFPEDALFSTETEFARRLREAGLKVQYMFDNPIWHRRTTTFSRFVRRNILISREKVGMLLHRGIFLQSAHGMLFAGLCGFVLLTAAACFSRPFAVLWLGGAALYAAAVLELARRALKRRGIRAATLLLLLAPCHHFSVCCGTLLGLLRGAKSPVAAA